MLAERQVTILNTLGLHVRPSAEFAGTAAKFKSRVSVVKDGQTVNGKSIMGVLMLVAAKGSWIHVKAQGEDAKQALDALATLVKDKFGED